MKKKQVLIEAQKSGKAVRVKYTNGSQPNRAREIIPLKIEKDKVLAKCLNSNTEKAFEISKLTILSDQQYNKLEKWEPNASFLTDYEYFVIQKAKRDKFIRYILIGIVLIIILALILKLKQ
jgi:tetrahydrodipicolinate N-succinyltransferase